MGKRKPKRQSRRELKQKAVEFKGGACERCGYKKCLAALTFHHKDPKQKKFNISEVLGNMSWNKIKNELNKCILLCQNCHSELHLCIDLNN